MYRVRLRGQVVRLLLVRRGWRQVDLAREVGVSAWTVNLWLNGRMNPRPEATNRLLEAFRGVSHKPRGRLTWDDLFSAELVETGGTSLI